MDNVYTKLQSARVELQSMSLKKSGKNAFQKYSYYELSDFLPQVNTLFNKVGLVTQFSMGDKATLTIINSTTPTEQIVFECPVTGVELKGGQPIQNLGAQITYLRRYLVMVALEIVESDFVDGQNRVNSIELDDDSLNKIMTAQTQSEAYEISKQLISKHGPEYKQAIIQAYNKRKSEL